MRSYSPCGARFLLGVRFVLIRGCLGEYSHFLKNRKIHTHKVFDIVLE